MTGSQNPCLHL
ncbi:hypothetical protein MXB_3057 [Myxobolus squamalis]|nr:hypothetical protein MXB_3057 [Myxobolus squamalis]